MDGEAPQLRRTDTGLSSSEKYVPKTFDYEKVNVLTIYWEDDEKEFYESVLRLKSVFSSFGYECSEYPLPIKPPHESYIGLTKELLRFKGDNDSEKALSVIYYSGHAKRKVNRNDLFWTRGNVDVNLLESVNKATLNWSSLQSLFLDGWKGHILHLLDCCNAGAFINAAHGTSIFEVICATDGEDLTLLQGPDSFTSFFLDHLEGSIETAISAADLTTEMRNTRANERARPGVKKVTPQHHHYSVFYGDRPNSMIMLGKRQKKRKSQPSLSQNSRTPSLPSQEQQRKIDAVPEATLASTHKSAPLEVPTTAKVVPKESILPTKSLHFPTTASTTGTTRPRIVEEFGRVYCPLQDDEIRVLNLFPSENDDADLEAYFSLVDIHSEGMYEPLSCRWERPGLMNITVDGYQTNISSHLHSALRHLRKKTETVALWVDVLCINRQDSRELSQQVFHMPDFFCNASIVHVWLGNSYPDSDLAFDLIPQLLDIQKLEKLVEAPADQNARAWTALMILMTSPYFDRRWLIQEFIVAKRAVLHCGSDTVDWTVFSEAVLLFLSRSEDVLPEIFPGHISSFAITRPIWLRDVRTYNMYSIVDASRRLYRKSIDGSSMTRLASLETLVLSFPGLLTTSPLDTIYSLLSLATYTNTPFVVDYAESTLDTFERFVKYCITESKSIDIICCHWAPSYANLPSWIGTISGLPFQHDGRWYGDSLVGLPSRRYYNAALGTTPLASFGHIKADAEDLVSDRSMIVGGFQLESLHTATFIGSTATNGRIPKDWLTIGDCEQLDNIVPDHFWRTMVADRGPDGVPTPNWYHAACLFCLKNPLPNDPLNTLSKKITQDYPSMATMFLKRVRDIIWNRRYVRTSKNNGGPFFALVPSETKLGDSICILYGCSVPVVLRPHEGRRAAWKLIGECFIYGMMDGEAMAVSEEAREGRMQEFELL
ncbi:hypothetical protein BDZ45DRAFT_101627 [Acephala macrosclerotiorum]|nr:hypothetical protein BDZ45DRAFT_101627 [Acephala macrosclerotiorum]